MVNEGCFGKTEARNYRCDLNLPDQEKKYLEKAILGKWNITKKGMTQCGVLGKYKWPPTGMTRWRHRGQKENEGEAAGLWGPS